MAITVTCPNGHTLRVKDKYAGQSGLCPRCRARVEVPNPERVSEDDVLDILGPSIAAPPALRPSEEFVHQDPRHDNVQEESGISLLGSSLLRRKKVCPRCCNIVSLAFANCPRCGTSLSACTVPPTDEQPKEPAESQPYRGLGLRTHGDVIVVRFAEHRIHDQSAVDSIGNELYRVADRTDYRHLLLNFASVVELSSLMLGNMLLLRKKIESKGGRLTLCQVDPDIREVFTAANLGRIFDIQDSEQDALEAFAANPSSTTGAP